MKLVTFQTYSALPLFFSPKTVVKQTLNEFLFFQYQTSRASFAKHRMSHTRVTFPRINTRQLAIARLECCRRTAQSSQNSSNLASRPDRKPSQVVNSDNRRGQRKHYYAASRRSCRCSTQRGNRNKRCPAG